MAAVESRLCSHTHLENGIHEFVLADTTFAAVEVWLKILNALYVHALSQDRILLLADVRRSSIQPLTYAFRRMQKWLVVHPKRPHTRCAFLTHEDIVYALKAYFAQLVHTGGTDVVRFFSAEQRDDAVAWLLSDERGMR